MTFVRVVLVLVALPALSAPAPETFLERTWHEVEVLLFLGPGEEPLVHEDLWREQPPPYSGRLIALLDEDERNVARLGSRTRNDLLQLDRVDLGVHAESRPDWMPPLGSSWESVAGSTLSSLGIPDLFVAWMLRPSPEVDTEFGEFDEQDEAPGTTMRDVADAFHAYEEQLDLTTYRWERANLVMANAASRLRRRGYEVLDHGRWHQELRSDGEVESVFLYAGKNRADRLYQVEGTVTYTQKHDSPSWQSMFGLPMDIQSTVPVSFSPPHKPRFFDCRRPGLCCPREFSTSITPKQVSWSGPAKSLYPTT